LPTPFREHLAVALAAASLTACRAQVAEPLSGVGSAPIPNSSTSVVEVVPNLDSAVLRVPPVSGARDYRAYALPSGPSASEDAQGRVQVNGTVVFCGGLRQRSLPITSEEAVPLIEVTGLDGPTELAV
jgi:hypothetical protein